MPTESPPPRRVLVVDDDVDMQTLLALYVRQAGCEVVATVGDGLTALETWRDHRHRGEPLDAIVLDQMMPEKTGLEVAVAIREDDQEVILLLISAAMTPALAALARGAGVEHTLSKNQLATLTSVLE